MDNLIGYLKQQQENTLQEAVLQNQAIETQAKIFSTKSVTVPLWHQTIMACHPLFVLVLPGL